MEGAKKHGVAGLIKGFGKGVAGVVLKPGAGKLASPAVLDSETDQEAIWGLPGYTFMGIYKELQKHFGSSVQNYIAAARTVQGHEDWKLSDHHERQEVIRRWHDIQSELSAEKERNTFHSPHSFLKQQHHKHSSGDGRKKSSSGICTPKKDRHERTISFDRHRSKVPSTTTPTPLSPLNAPTDSALPYRHSPSLSDHAAFEEAMLASDGLLPPRSDAAEPSIKG